MAQQLDHIEYLSKEIGPRPAGTEEEQQAALYIAEQFQQEAGFSTNIEDIVSSSNIESPCSICSIVTVVVSLIAVIFTPFTVPAAIIALLSAAVYVLEKTGRPFVTKALAKGASQNVVAKYEPASAGASGRSRKVVLVAHYDSGKVKPKLVNTVQNLPLPWPAACLGAMVFLPVFMLLRALVFPEASGAVAIVLNIIAILAVLVAALPAAKAVLYRTAPFSEGANDNAAGVALLLETAKNISKGLVSADEPHGRPSRARIHGEEAALAQGLVPDGAQLEYHAEPTTDSTEDGDLSAEDRLSAAKAAIAALTGTAVSTTSYVGQARVHEQAVDIDAAEPGLAASSVDEIRITEIPVGGSDTASQGPSSYDYFAPSGDALANDAAQEPAAQAQVEPEIVIDENVPDWFASAQRKAKRSSRTTSPAQRSRYADALDAALNQSSAYFDEANKLVESESEDRIRARSADIVEVAPPVAGATDAAATAVASTPVTASVDEEAELPLADGFSVEPAAEDAAAEPASAVQDEAPESEEVAVAGSESTVAPAAGETAAFAPLTLDLDELRAAGAGQEVDAPVSQEAAADATAPAAPVRAQRNIALPGFDQPQQPQEPLENAAPDFEVQGQRAPLAGDAPAGTLAAGVPQIAGIPEQTVPSKSGALRALRTKLPSLSGSIERIGDEDLAVSNVSTVGSFVAAGATGSIEPVGDELLSDLDPEDAYIDDADDSDIEENYTETGAFAGPGYVDMPKSRVRRFFDKFRFSSKNDAQDEETPQEWLDVEDEFDPRAVGKERGGWESFRDEEIQDRRAGRAVEDDYAAAEGSDYNQEYGDYAEDAYDSYSDGYADSYDDAFDDSWDNDRRWQGGAMSRVRLGRVNTTSTNEGDAADAAAALEEDVETPEEIKRIYQFRNPDFDTEVWFVALGSEVELHDGIRSFLDAHQSELRGAVIVDIEAVGAGTLSYAQKEGALRATGISSRVKRFLQKASRESGIPCEAIDLEGTDSAASIAAAAGMQALHLLGAEDGGKALTNDDVDVVDNIDPQRLEENTYFVEELLKAI